MVFNKLCCLADRRSELWEKLETHTDWMKHERSTMLNDRECTTTIKWFWMELGIVLFDAHIFEQFKLLEIIFWRLLIS